jgi:Ca2+:H+ antiporter
MTTPRRPRRWAWLEHIEPLYYLLIALPAAIVLHFLHAQDLWVFAASAVAIIPLAGLMGRATENLAETLGSGIGGLLNATFGNAAELIIALMVLRKGPEMFPTVKATITGSIIGNQLLVLGLAVLAGGARFRTQKFNATGASAGTAMLALAATALLAPTLYRYTILADQHIRSPDTHVQIVSLSEEISVVLLVVYALSLLFSLVTHKHLFAGDDAKLQTTGETEGPEWSRKTSLIVLLLATIGVAVMSELLVESIKEAGESLHLNDIFMGVIVVAIIGNAAEHSTAVLMAMKNKMDLAMNVALSSSIQIALFVAPVLVFASMFMGHTPALDLHFTLMETLALVLSVALLAIVVQDGESHWMEGILLLAVYFIFGLVFYHLPQAPHSTNMASP